MHIPEHILEEIRSRSDIVEVIGEHVRLQKRGKNYLGLCPFHSEKTPSFNVNAELGIYKCFGCGKSGNVFKFLMEHNGTTFPEAVKLMAQRAGVTIEDEELSAEQRDASSRTDAAHRALGAASDFYAHQLRTKVGSLAYQYFSKRGFSEEILASFALGYSPEDWQQTTNELIRQGYSEQTLEDGGLVIRREDGSIHDRFRGRAMFPIHDAMGRIVGFGARILRDDKSQAKYVNSPQSLVYDKSKILYGLYQAKQSIRHLDKAILTEGYADTISLHQFGFQNTVASSGTSLTEDQLRLLSRYTKNLVIIYDGDDAGINAAKRGVELALQSGFEVSIVTLPSNEDPDTFVRTHGAEALTAYIREARSFIDFMAERFRAQGQFSTPKGLADAVRSLMSLVSLVTDQLHREFLIRSLAQKFSLREELLYAELKGVSIQQAQRPQYQRATTSASPATQSVQKPSTSSMHLLSEERALLHLAMTSPNALMHMETQYGISRETFPTPAAQSIFYAIEHATHNGIDLASLMTESEILTDEERSIVADIMFSQEQPSINWSLYDVQIQEADIHLVIPDTLVRLRLHAVKTEFSVQQELLKANPEDLSILQRLMVLTRERKELEDTMRQITQSTEDE